MPCMPVFLSVVIVSRNAGAGLAALLTDAARIVADLAQDFELVVIDNASDDHSVAVLRELAGEGGLPNLQVYALTKEVDADTASWAGLESALGDYVAVLDPARDDIGTLGAMLERAAGGVEVVFAANLQKPRASLAYRIGAAAFDLMYKWFNGVRLARDAPRFRVLSRRVVNFILQHPRPEIAYRHLPATGGFARAHVAYSAAPGPARPMRLAESLDRGMRLLVSTTQGPMRIVTALSVFGAVANAVYSGYVIAVAFLKADVAPGWITLSLQQSGMFLLISLVLLVLGEYILNMASLSDKGPRYHVAQEFTSVTLTRRNKLNVEAAPAADPLAQAITVPVLPR